MIWMACCAGMDNPGEGGGGLEQGNTIIIIYIKKKNKKKNPHPAGLITDALVLASALTTGDVYRNPSRIHVKVGIFNIITISQYTFKSSPNSTINPK